jgi:ribosomal-protein-alanine N-acetyltransferase
VLAIEHVVFADPWSREDFEGCVSADALFLVAISKPDAALLGYLIALDTADEGEILNLAVAPNGRRHGVGRALVEEALEQLAGRGVQQVYLEVRESNAAARALYAAYGFEEVGRRRRYYRRPVEDAIVLRAEIGMDTSDA